MSPKRRLVAIYIALIAVNLLILPNWFGAGRFSLQTRALFIAVSIGVIALCAYKLSTLLGWSIFRRRR